MRTLDAGADQDEPNKPTWAAAGTLQLAANIEGKALSLFSCSRCTGLAERWRSIQVKVGKKTLDG